MTDLYSDTEAKVSNIVAELFPAVYREDAPNLVEFVKAYYTWAEDSDNMDNALRLLRGIRDISETPDAYISYHQGEMQTTIPQTTVANSKLLIRNILAFYRARGSEQSFKTLFRAVYGANVEIYYPYNDTFIASGSRWYQEKNIRVTIFSGSIDDCVEQTLTGASSGATCYVDSVTSEIISGIQYYRLVISDVVGTFQNDEILATSDNSVQVVAQGISDYLIMDTGAVPSAGDAGGVLNQINDVLEFVGVGSNDARGQVIDVDDQTCIEVSLDYKGKGYTVSNTAIVVQGGSGISAAVVVTGISNTSIINVNTQTILGSIAIPINAPDWGNTALYAPTPFFSPTALANTIVPSLRYKTITVGSIATLRTTNYGYGYSTLPANSAVIATDSYILTNYNLVDADRPAARWGNSATFTIAHKPGYITAVEVTDVGSGYQSNENIVLKNLSRASVNASATFGANNQPLNTLDGFYLTTSGHASSEKKIQDSAYYNKFTYEIRAPIDQSTYRDYVKKVLHPAGTRMYGSVVFNDVLTMPLEVSSNVSAVAYP